MVGLHGGLDTSLTLLVIFDTLLGGLLYGDLALTENDDLVLDNGRQKKQLLTQLAGPWP